MFKQLILNDRLILSFEPLGKNVRLIVSEGDQELACRKESIKVLQNFLSTESTPIFKGRLQLNKQKDIIEVILKDKAVAIVASANFKKILNNLQ